MTKEEQIYQYKMDLINKLHQMNTTIQGVINTMESVAVFDKSYLSLGKMDIGTGFESLVRSVMEDSEARDYFKDIK